MIPKEQQFNQKLLFRFAEGGKQMAKVRNKSFAIQNEHVKS